MAKARRIILLSFGSVLAVAAVAYFILIPTFAPQIVAAVLLRSGASTAEISSFALGVGTLDIGKTKLQWNRPDGQQVAGVVENLKLSFSFSSLRSNRIDSLTAEKVTAEIISGTSPRESKSADIDSTIAEIKFPFSSAIISDLKLQWKSSATSSPVVVHGALTFANRTLSLLEDASIEIPAALAESTGATFIKLLSPLRLTLPDGGQPLKIAPANFEISPPALPSGIKLSVLEGRLESQPKKRGMFLLTTDLRGSIGWGKVDQESSAPFSLQTIVDGNSRLDPLPTISVKLSLPSLNIGLPLFDLELSSETRLPSSEKERLEVRIRKAQLKVLEGRVQVTPFSFAPAAKRNEATFAVSGINLQKLFDTYPGARVSGEGLLDGTIKVQRTNSGVVTAAGKLAAQAPGGTLRGDLSQWTSAHPDNKSIALAAEALRNFNFSSLVTDVEYHENGDLILKVSLKGANPELNLGKAMSVNITIEENLPALFKTSRLIGQS
jgi:hypothetical protein